MGAYVTEKEMMRVTLFDNEVEQYPNMQDEYNSYIARGGREIIGMYEYSIHVVSMFAHHPFLDSIYAWMRPNTQPYALLVMAIRKGANPDFTVMGIAEVVARIGGNR
jgi:hypothetical protein